MNKKNNTEMLKLSDTMKERKIKPKVIFYAIGENHPSWKSGIAFKSQRNILKNNNRDISKCQICKNNKSKLMVHHIDGNRYNNQVKNLGILCYFCHNAIHDNPNKIKERFQTGHSRNKHYEELLTT